MQAVRTWADSFGLVFQEASQNLPGSSPTDQSQLLILLQTWARFMPTWLHASATALSIEKGVSKAESIGLAAKEIWVKLQTLISEALPRVAENATLAAAALCGSLHGNASSDLAGSVTSFLVKRLSEADGREWAERTTAVALGSAAASLPVTERERRGLAVEGLLRVYQRGESSGSARFAAGLALGLVGQSLGRRSAEESDDVMVTSASDVAPPRGRDSALVRRILGAFLAAILGGAGGEAVCPIVEQLAATWQVDALPHQRGGIADEWASVGAIAGLSQICAGGHLPALLSNPGSITGCLNLLKNLADIDRFKKGETSEPVLIAALLALPVLIPLGHRLELVSTSQAEQQLESLAGLLQNPAQTPPAVYAAAALSAGALLDSLLADGCPLSVSTIDQVFNPLGSPSGESSQGVAYRVGLLLGLANALGAGFGVSGRRDGTESRQGGRILDDEGRVAQAREAVQRLAKCVKEDSVSFPQSPV
jgi:hypothetical protein